MTNEETLELLKPIMLDGTEKVGDIVYCTRFGYCEIQQIIGSVFPIHTSYNTYTECGHINLEDPIPALFKVNPFEWLANQNNSQERVIEVLDGNKWIPRVLIKITKQNHAVCWWEAKTIEEAKAAEKIYKWTVWRELPTKITKEEALRKCDEIGIDVKDMLLNALGESGVDTTNLIIE